MTQIGVFRDDFYNAMAALPVGQYTAITTTLDSGVLGAVSMAGATHVFVALSGQTAAQGVTTDTAAAIISVLQNAVAVQYKATQSGFGAGVSPPAGVPNLFNVTYLLTVVNNNTSDGAVTFTGGTGVTFTGTDTIAIGTAAHYLITVTSPTTVTIQYIYTTEPTVPS